ncbi:MAG: glycosyltransferase [Deltaproteobacteria bacterium]|nr:glycosyltransferase [Deltaproteobacteria bacterium]
MENTTLLLCLLLPPLLTALVTLSYPLHTAFFFWRQRRRLRAREGRPAFVSLIVPMKGVDDELPANVISWTQQCMGVPFEILVCVEREDDPAVPMIRALMKGRAAAGDMEPRMELLITGRSTASLGKMHNLIHGIEHACGDWLVFVDSDAYFPDSHYLRRFMVPLGNPGVGLVSCYPAYRGARDVGAALIGGAINNDFVGFMGLLGTWQRRFAVAVGTTMAMRRDTLEVLGGLDSLRQQLLMDVSLARRVRDVGYRVHLCEEPVVVYQRHSSTRAALQKADRWHVGMRRMLSAPLYGLYLLLRLSLPLALLSVALRPCATSVGVVLALVVVRWVAVCSLNLRYIRDPCLPWLLWMVPVTDLLMGLSAMSALLRHKVSWRGQIYRIGKGGRAHLEREVALVKGASGA